jgi:hypothetical protein
MRIPSVRAVPPNRVAEPRSPFKGSFAAAGNAMKKLANPTTPGRKKREICCR